MPEPSALSAPPPPPVDTPGPSQQSDSKPPTPPISGAPRRRDKAQLSCTVCRRRKLRCDRNEPCGSCSSRGLSLSCVYLANGKQTHRQTPQTPSKGKFQDRINQLETLIVSLKGALEADKNHAIKQRARELSPERSAVLGDALQSREIVDSSESEARISDTFGRISLENSETSYVGSEHWMAILDEVAELKDLSNNNSDQNDNNLNQYPQPDTELPFLLFGRNLHVTKQEIIAAIPPKPILDRLLSKYFDTMDMAPVIVHAPTFLKEYTEFWNNPLGTSTMWLSVLFSMMCLTTLFQQGEQSTEDELGIIGLLGQANSDPQHSFKLYMEKAVQCLVLGNYTKAAPYTIEALLLYYTSEHFRSQDTQIGVWVLFGMVIRMAMRMGYHRDPSHSPGISLFHGEMRRRVWATIVQLDMAVSSQFGLPRTLREELYDTAYPQSLLDTDLSEEMVDLPLPRAHAELTPIGYCNAKSRMLSTFGIIVDHTSSMRPHPYTEVMRIDYILNDTYLAIPPGLKLRTMSESILDPSNIILGRIYLDSIFHKAKCMLHRKYLLPARSNEQYIYSRQSCIASSLQLLKHQSALDHETQPDGRLHKETWKISSLTNYDFLLAATILCVILDYDTNSPAQGLKSPYQDEQTEVDIIRALSEAYRIFTKSGKSSREAQKAAKALEIVLQKINQVTMAKSLNTIATPTDASRFNGQSAFPSLEPTPAWKPRVEPFSQFTTSTQGAPTTIPNNESLQSLANDFDWAAWDSQFQIEDPSQFMFEQNDLGMFGNCTI